MLDLHKTVVTSFLDGREGNPTGRLPVAEPRAPVWPASRWWSRALIRRAAAGPGRTDGAGGQAGGQAAGLGTALGAHSGNPLDAVT